MDSSTLAITPLTRFLAACSYLPKTPASLRHQRQLLENASAAPLQPEALWQGIQRHRIFALAERVLRTHSLLNALGPFQTALATRAQHEQIESLKLFAESLHFSSLLARQSIEHRFLKGPLLSKKIYGDPGLRHTRDLDLHVRVDDISSTINLLQSDHWTPVSRVDVWQSQPLYRWIAQRRLRHFKFVHQQKKLTLELHWRFEQSQIPRFDSLWWGHGIGGDAANVTHAEFLQLCLHGASHAWFRLKWIGDLQAILDRQPGLWNETRNLSHELGLGLIVDQAVLLLHCLFESESGHRTSVILQPQTQLLEMVKFAVNCLQNTNPKEGYSANETSALRRYLLKLDQRLPLYARLADFLSLCLVDSEDLENWNRPAACLAAIPFMRASKLLSRYCFHRKASLNPQHSQTLHR